MTMLTYTPELCANISKIMKPINKIFIIGLPRTGTTSICAALLAYDYKVAHTAYTKHAFELADVIADAPCFSDYQHLDKLFPGSAFVYLHRELDLWIPSIQMLLKKMLPELGLKTGYLNSVLKRSFHQTFALSTTADPISSEHLAEVFHKHQQEIVNYFAGRDNLLSLDISQKHSLSCLLRFLGIHTEGTEEFPHLNLGKQVDNWKQLKHPNKINALSAGKDQKKFFDYQ